MPKHQPSPANIRLATQRDRSYMTHLAKQFPVALGFIPDSAVQTLIDARSVWVAREAGQHAGYILARPRLSTSPTVRPIIQACVDFSAQRRHIGIALLDALANDARDQRISVLTAWCRSELAANEFWRSAGFREIATRPGGKKSGGVLRLWARQLGQIDMAALLLKPNDRPRGPGGRVSRTPLIVTPTDAFYSTQNAA